MRCTPGDLLFSTLVTSGITYGMKFVNIVTPNFVLHHLQ